MRSYSEETARLIDNEIKGIIDLQYSRTLALLREHQHGLEEIVRVLLERETLHADEFSALMRGDPLPEHEPYVAPNSVPTAPTSNKPDKPSKGPLLPPGMMPRPG